MAVTHGELVAGRYLVEERLGAGGMGEVHRARDERLGRAVALKVLPAAAIGDEAARARLVREARAAAQLEHPGIVHVYDVGATDDGGAFLVMELVTGKTLGTILREGRLSLIDRRRILVEAARALGFAHGRGFLHRDVKPDNVMVRDDGRAVVLDFGLAKKAYAEIGAEAITQEGAFLGTPAYIAPEQARGDAVDARADQFALGVVAYEVLTGSSPWRGTSPVSLLSHVLSVDPAAATTVAPGLPPAVDAVLARALAKRPDARYPSMEAFADALDALPLGDGVVRSAADVLESATAPTEVLSPANVTGSTGVTPRAPASRGRVLGAVAVGLAVFATASAAFVLARPRAQATPPASSATPLARRDARIACPQLRVEGVEAPAGWLGAAAAGLACERARVVLGGDYARTLVPAELLDLPREPVESMPADPYDADGARATSVLRANERGAAWLDGTVTRGGERFEVELVLRRGETELGRGSGEGVALFEAVFAAMDPLVARGAIPKAALLDPEVRDWLGASSVDDALLILEARSGLFEYGPSLGAFCANALRSPAHFGRYEPMARWTCTYVRGEPGGATRSGPLDASSPGRLAIDAESRIALDPKANAKDISATLLERLQSETSPLGRARLAGIASCFLQPLGRDEEALHLAVRAVRSLPKDADGSICFGWAQLLTLSRDPANLRTATRGFQAWLPWVSAAWTGDTGEPERDLRNARRGYVLSPYNVLVVLGLTDLLFARGLRQEARTYAVAMEQGGPLQRLAAAIVLARIAEEEAQLGAALDRARRTLEGPQGAGFAVTLRWELAARALQVALVLGRARELSDAILPAAVDVDPPPYDTADVDMPLRLAALCAVASKDVASRCFGRIKSFIAAGTFSNLTESTRAAVDGAERYSRGDLAGAARIFRPLVRNQGIHVGFVHEIMAEVFEKQGEDTLVQTLDAPALDGAGKREGASLANVRAARRAAKAGDRETARQNAERVVRAWSVADVDVPAVAEMRALLAKLR